MAICTSLKEKNTQYNFFPFTYGIFDICIIFHLLSKPFVDVFHCSKSSLEYIWNLHYIPCFLYPFVDELNFIVTLVQEDNVFLSFTLLVLLFILSSLSRPYKYYILDFYLHTKPAIVTNLIYYHLVLFFLMLSLDCKL